MADTPVALVIFNRPDLTARVVEALRAVRPARLFVIADGPRPGRVGEADRCAAARAVIERIDWECAIVKDYAAINLGSGKRVSSGLAWLFEQVDEAIILEDDCLPDPSFFRFCHELLARYRHDDRVMMISGMNPFGRWRAETESYHFSHYGAHWGWATWKRAWRHYDFEMRALRQPATPIRLLEVTGDPDQVAYHLQLCDLIASGQVASWDVQWTLTQLLRGGLAVVPARNLVSNIGFGPDATHTYQPFSMTAARELYTLTFPLVDPASGVSVDREYDRRFGAWRLGRPDAELVIEHAERQLAAHRNAQALLSLEAALRSGLPLTPDQRARINLLRANALEALGSPGRALAAARAALADMPNHPDALQLLDALRDHAGEGPRR